MRWFVATMSVASVGACYRQPASDASCTIVCDGSCPDGLACVDGYCTAPGQTCAPQFREVHAGNGFACALDARDLLWCWGSNLHHQLAPDDRATLEVVSRIGDRAWDTIATGGGQICGLRDGRLWCWGANDHGQVSGTVVGDVTDPLEIVPPVGGARWSAVATGYDDTCAIAGGRLYCWGAGDSGQLGTGSTNDVGTPTPVITDLADWQAVSTNAGRAGGTDIEDVGGTMPGTPWGHTCAISQSAGLWCWGAGGNGELGDGSLVEHDTPVAVTLPAAPVEVSVGEFTTCAITADQQLYCWGSAAAQALGDPATVTPELGGAAHAATPILASTLTGWTHVEAAEELACALRDDEVWCWGTTRGGGGLADGVWGTQDWKQVATGARALTVGWNAAVDDIGYDHGDLDLGCVLDASGIACWGDNRFAQLAQGAGVMAAQPREIAGSHHWSLLRAGGNHACGVADGQLLCWGSTVRGEATAIVSGTAAVPCGSAPDLPCDVGGPAPLPFAPAADALALGRAHACVLAGAAVTCWGDDAHGQLGSIDAGNRATVPGAWTALLDTGTDAQCARQGTETWCWGSVMGATTAPAHLAAFDGLTSVGVGGWFDGTLTRSFGCGLDGAMQLVCYGDNFRGEFGNGDQTGAACGNAVCDQGETTDTCPGDCGPAPLTHLARRYRSISVGYPTDHLYYDGVHYNVTAYTCGITLDQHVECWGRNFRGQMGVDPGPYPHQVTLPSRIAGLDSCTVVSASDYHACAICGGDVKCWGDHRYGAVGAGPVTDTVITTPRTIDVTLDAGDAWAELVSGVGFSCARTQQGRAYCWGFSPHGALGTGATSSPLPVRVKR